MSINFNAMQYLEGVKKAKAAKDKKNYSHGTKGDWMPLERQEQKDREVPTPEKCYNGFKNFPIELNCSAAKEKGSHLKVIHDSYVRKIKTKEELRGSFFFKMGKHVNHIYTSDCDYGQGDNFYYILTYKDNSSDEYIFTFKFENSEKCIRVDISNNNLFDEFFNNCYLMK